MNSKNTISVVILAALFIVLLLIAFSVGLFFHHNIASIGTEIGSTSGTIVGSAIGSYKGFTEGYEEGANDGLDAEDTTAEIKGSMESIGNLEVLAAGVTLKNINNIGDAYKGLYIINGDAIFSVNLNNADISYSEDKSHVYVLIPKPELELFLDQASTKKLAETQHFSLSVSAEDGLKAYLNTMSQSVDNVKKTLVNYDSLMTIAMDTARMQVSALVSAVCGDSQIIHVEFKR